MKEPSDHSIVEGLSHPPNHIQHLKEEIEYLKTQIKESGSGHIYTTIGVLQERVNELSRWVIRNY